MEPHSRRYAHSEGVTHICFDSQRRIVSCGRDSEVRLLASFDGDESSEFSVSSEKLTALACYQTPAGSDVVAVAMDDNTVQAYASDGAPVGLLMRFTGAVTCMATNQHGSLLAAGSAEFLVKVVEVANISKSVSLTGHEAPVLSVNFDPQSEHLASSSCDGTVRIWSIKTKECLRSLPVLGKCNDVSLAKSLAQLSWQPPSGKLLAIPVGSEVKVYERSSWKFLFSLSEEPLRGGEGRGGVAAAGLNVVSWSPCGGYLATGGVAGGVALWDHVTCKVYRKFKNENGIGITSLEWDPRGRGNPQLAFADNEGYIGTFHDVYPSNQTTTVSKAMTSDPLADDSLLMEGIPADDIFDNDFDNDDDIIPSNAPSNSNQGDDDDDDEILQSRKRRRLQAEENDPITSEHLDDDLSNQSDPRRLLLDDQEPVKKVISFQEKQVEVYHKSLQPSATPEHLQHRFMVYNLVGVVRCHSDEAAMIEVEFHDSSTHHSFSLANHFEYSLAALSSEALVLASERKGDSASQLQCTHFSSWDNLKDWTIELPSKESIKAVAIGDGWIAIATSKRQVRLFTVGGVQREVISVPGVCVTVCGWGGRMAVVYQTGPCTENVFGLTVWVLDVKRRKQLHHPHTLPLSHHAKLEWIGFSEDGCLVTYDSKATVRVLSGCYGGLSWIPVLDTSKQLTNKDDHYFIVGMTHNPVEIRGIVCKGISYPPVHPRPVISSLPLRLPLCEMSTERAQIEELYTQEVMVGQNSDATHTQLLMKLFALACKMNREYRALEIAAMMPNERAMNLALTYASRTQKVRLARRINELIQQKSIEQLSDDELLDDRYHDNQVTTNQIADDRQRNETEPTAPRNVPSVSTKKIVLQKKSSKTSEKFERYMEEIQKGKFLSASTTSNSRRKRANFDPETADEDMGNETKELFSDSDGDGGEGEGSVAMEANEEEEDATDILDDDGLELNTPTPQDSVLDLELEPNTDGKKSNPFKMATPVSKRVQMDRQTSFLDNISTKVDEEKEDGERRKKRGVARAVRAPGRRVSKDKGKKLFASKAQTNLKGAFFSKQKAAAATGEESKLGNTATSPVDPLKASTSVAAAIAAVPSVAGGGEGPQGKGKSPGAVGDSPNEEEAEAEAGPGHMNSRQKLASFAFKS